MPQGSAVTRARVASKVRATSFITLPASLACEVNSNASERYTKRRAAGDSSTGWISMALEGTNTMSGQVRFSTGRRVDVSDADAAAAGGGVVAGVVGD